jgi:polyisoprenoid-binding protein YceI
MLRIATAVAACCCALPLIAQGIDYGRSRITIVSKQMKVPVEAEFRKFTAAIEFDPARPEAGRAQIEIDLASFDIGDAETNNDARGRNWFDTRTFPTAKFVSSSIRAVSAGRYEVRGPLTIKGRTHEVTAPFAVKSDGTTRLYAGAFVLRRLQYNIGDGVWRDTDIVADEVEIRFRVVQAAGKPTASK